MQQVLSTAILRQQKNAQRINASKQTRGARRGSIGGKGGWRGAKHPGEAPGPDHAAPDGGGAWAQLAVTGPACGPGRHAREEEDRAGARTIVAARA
ncbi:hypothetical protein BCEP4_300002 [Burkholderia cepacia]|nr:hypothetical protein BCEP4_300002 [Burkholderia cepacia]